MHFVIILCARACGAPHVRVSKYPAYCNDLLLSRKIGLNSCLNKQPYSRAKCIFFVGWFLALEDYGLFS